MKSGMAKIEVQNSFCTKCSAKIKVELLKIENITNVYLYPFDSLIVFNFVRANELSTALNTLMALGYPPKGDRIDIGTYVHPWCQCSINSRETLFQNTHAGLTKIE
ncbi:hypothetical protein [Ulvibacterium sp.]|uniref:hypothetical protein n=1 Tax=Ulvibacterium sp. TaxID=2665914 RepID=UPI002628F00F|nr:hypothetical protein [Ulvibacterium sp.]